MESLAAQTLFFLVMLFAANLFGLRKHPKVALAVAFLIAAVIGLILGLLITARARTL